MGLQHGLQEPRGKFRNLCFYVPHVNTTFLQWHDNQDKLKPLQGFSLLKQGPLWLFLIRRKTQNSLKKGIINIATIKHFKRDNRFLIMTVPLLSSLNVKG
jgi:hypothetical protein